MKISELANKFGYHEYMIERYFQMFQEDKILDFLDVLWDQMSENSRKQVDTWIKAGMP